MKKLTVAAVTVLVALSGMVGASATVAGSVSVNSPCCKYI